MERLERLINLVAALLDAERPLTAAEIRDRVPGYAEEKGAFRRAFERDKDALRDLGVPVVLEDVGESTETGLEGYRIRREDYELRDPGLEPDELAALHLAASAVQLDGAQGLQALWKLGGAVVEEGPAPAVAALPGSAHLGVLFEAISERRVVSFEYRGHPRTVEPFALSFRNGWWYLAARDRDRGDERSYRLDRFESVPVATGGAGAFDVPSRPRGALPAWQMGTDEAVDAELRVDADQAGWAVSHVGGSAVERRDDDGSVVLRVSVTNRAAFRSFVLGFLDHAEVLGPPVVRAEMVEWLEALCPG